MTLGLFGDPKMTLGFLECPKSDSRDFWAHPKCVSGIFGDPKRTMRFLGIPK